MKYCALIAFSLFALGCGEGKKSQLPSLPVKPPAKKVDEADSTHWTFTSKQYGISVRLPADWHQENMTNKDPTYSDADSKSAAHSLYDESRLALSAVSGLVSKNGSPAYLQVFFLLQKESKRFGQVDVKDALEDLKATYPDGDPQVSLVELPAGPALRELFGDVAEMGTSDKGATKNVRTVDVLNIQYRISIGSRLYVINLAGSKSDELMLTALGDEIALSLKVD
jgi:hypothetical protein